MELADRNLQSVLFDYQGQGSPGLLRATSPQPFLREAAEALDVINFEYGLQHLDVKPHNLFVVSNHIKVADFGLVHRLPGADAMRRPGVHHGDAMLLYASPWKKGSLSRHSDQYSLAIVYRQVLTGTVPFWSANPYQLLMMHVAGTPDLTVLPPADRPLIGRRAGQVAGTALPLVHGTGGRLMQVTDAGGEVRVRAAPHASNTPAQRSVARRDLRAALAWLPSANDEATMPSVLAQLPRLTLADLPPPAARPLPEPALPEPRPMAAEENAGPAAAHRRRPPRRSIPVLRRTNLARLPVDRPGPRRPRRVTTSPQGQRIPADVLTRL